MSDPCFEYGRSAAAFVKNLEEARSALAARGTGPQAVAHLHKPYLDIGRKYGRVASPFHPRHLYWEARDA